MTQHLKMNFTANDACRKAITVEPTWNLSDARDIMIRHNISRVIVAAKNNPIGMVTEKAIASYLFKNSNEPLDTIVISKTMRTPVVTISIDASITRCAKVMIENNISSLVVMNGTSLNIMTKSDLVRLYAEHYRKTYHVSDFMTKNVCTISPSHSLHTALVFMIKYKISRVVVTKGKEIEGIITSRDLMPITSFVEGDGIESKNLSGIGHIMLARDVMNKPLIINKNADLAEAAQIMYEKRISGMPVAATTSDLDGIITKTDIVRALIEANNKAV
ncbi:MAG TPA: CBS domain-containing protein [Candidatus Bathyarchaeia archaeon]|nr:CBS domain-containing protein [Candidatus Bathyarchaeia archaeon]